MVPPAGAVAPPGFPADPAAPVYAGTPVMAETAPEPPRRRRSRGATVAIWLLSIALLLVLAGGAWLTYQYLEAQELISDQQEELEDQREIIDEKESFGAAMAALMTTTEKFDSALTATIVPWSSYERLAERGWAVRRDADKLAALTEKANAEAAELDAVWTAAQQEASTNASGTTYEAVIDSLGGGFVRSVIDRPDCGAEEEGVLGCVYGEDPYLVHFDADGNAQPYMTDEIRTGIAYHEFAHVLQFTNPEATETALEAFDDDWETMADCFALTYLPGWSLDHRVWTSDYEYWDVTVGYGVTCSEPQRQVVRDWYSQLGVELQSVGGE